MSEVIGPTLYLPMLSAAPQQPSGPNEPDWIGPTESTFEGWGIDCFQSFNISGSGHRKASGHVKRMQVRSRQRRYVGHVHPFFKDCRFEKEIMRHVPSGHQSHIYTIMFLQESRFTKRGIRETKKKIPSNFNFRCKVWVIFRHPCNHLILQGISMRCPTALGFQTFIWAFCRFRFETWSMKVGAAGPTDEAVRKFIGGHQRWLL